MPEGLRLRIRDIQPNGNQAMTMQVDKARLDALIDGKTDQLRLLEVRFAKSAIPEDGWEHADLKRDAEIILTLATELRSLRSTEGKEPDHCYDPEDWEYTQSWEDRNEFVEQWDVNTPHRVATLIDGPDRWCVLHWDEVNGVETSWYNSEADARAALTRSPE